jgi:4-hydroxythreonine-4-phosphate dehydrogenase
MEKKDPQQGPRKLKVGITFGDFNGIGPEIIIKALHDARMANLCTPIVYGSGKILTKYKRLLDMEDFNYHQFNSNSYLNERKVNVVNCWPDTHEVEPGRVTETAGHCAYLALEKAVADLKEGFIDAVVTCPINKANIQRDEFRFAGHTEFFAAQFGPSESLMMLCHEQLRVAVATGHIPLSEVSGRITKELLEKKLDLLHQSLQRDFGIAKPKIAVLGLNPHAGEDGLLGKEDDEIIRPVLIDKQKRGKLVYGPFPADGFFGTYSFQKYDAVLAMYHDQGLIPFKTIAFEKGVNFTAGLPIVRTSPDHGTAYGIAGKGVASEASLREAIFMAIDIAQQRLDAVERQLRVPAKH